VYREPAGSGPEWAVRSAQPLASDQLALLEQGGFARVQHDLGVEDPVARTVCEHALLRATGLTTYAAAQRLRVSEERVRERLAARTLYGIEVGGEWRLPSFQFAQHGLVPGIERVLPELPEGLHPVAVYRWLSSPSLELERRDGRALTPLEWLRSCHDPAAVVELARDL
jgi:hypothetical protein